MRVSLRPLRAFSLVEVTLALGVAAFATLALFGLLSVGLQGGRTASGDAAIARIAESVVSDLKRRPFETLNGLAEDLTFNESGALESSPEKTTHLCRVQVSGFALPGLLPESTSPVSLRVRMEFYRTPGQLQPIDVIETVISRY